LYRLKRPKDDTFTTPWTRNLITKYIIPDSPDLNTVFGKENLLKRRPAPQKTGLSVLLSYIFNDILNILINHIILFYHHLDITKLCNMFSTAIPPKDYILYFFVIY